jgi:2'-5' RNA ligase
MRLFIAIPLPPDVMRAAASARVALESYGAKGRLVPRENYHITLLSGDDRLAEAADAIREAVRDITLCVAAEVYWLV